VTIDHMHTCATGVTDLRDHAVRLMKRCECYCMRGRCDGQSKGSKAIDLIIFFPPIFCVGFFWPDLMV
jgi:hypothetical protein